MALKSLSLQIVLVCFVAFSSLLVLIDLMSIGVRIEFLPPYSPDLNPIEEAFSKIKYFLRRNQAYYGGSECGDAIMYDLYEVCEIITADDAHGYFMHGGYF